MDIEDIEYNEQRVREIEIPLHKLEERVKQLESHISNYSVSEVSTSICNKINLNLKGSLPKVWNDISKMKEQIF